MTEPSPAPSFPVPVLFLVADTGGGHRAAAQAVAGCLRQAWPGRFEPVLLDPLAGPGSAWLLRRVARLYGPAIRHVPWLWGAAYRVTDSRPAMTMLDRVLLRLADRPVARAVTALPPALVVSFHPLVNGTAARAARDARPGRGRLPLLTVVTDLGRVHAAWRHGRADWLVVPPGGAGPASAAGTCLELGLPVAAGFAAGPLASADRAELRRELGAGGQRFLAVVTGGGEGAGRMPAAVRALLRGHPDIGVAALCGRNERLRRRLTRLAARYPGRLTVRGFVANMADWLRCADVVVTKAGPGTIAEAACCGAPMMITGYLPGQEAGNAGLVVGAGAGSYTPRPADLVREAGRLRRDPAALAGMRAASARLGRPGAAAAVAGLIARQAARPRAGAPPRLPPPAPQVQAPPGTPAPGLAPPGLTPAQPPGAPRPAGTRLAPSAGARP